MIKVTNENHDISDKEIVSMINRINSSKSKSKLSALSDILDKVNNRKVLNLRLSDKNISVSVSYRRIGDNWIGLNDKNSYTTYDIANKLIKNKYVAISIS